MERRPEWNRGGYYLTAYGIAVKHGFVGTEEEWLASLKGDTGEQGVPGYDFRVKGAYPTLADLEENVPEPEQGDTYLVGSAAARTCYMYLGPDATEEGTGFVITDGWALIGDLSGPQGDQGEQGIQGETGATGRGIAYVRVLDSGELKITYDDGESETIGKDVYEALDDLREATEGLRDDARTAAQDAEAYAIDVTNKADAVAQNKEATDNAKYAAEAAQTAAEAAQSSASYSASAAGDSAEAAATWKNTAEAWAVGTINGTPVASTAPQYENNSKYWAEEAGDSADEAAASAASVSASAAQIETNKEDISDLKNVNGYITENPVIPLEKNHGIDLSGSTVTMSDGVPQYTSIGTTSFSCGMMQCSEGDFFTVRGTGGNSARLWGFVDASGNILAVADANATADNRLTFAPKNAAWIIVHTSDGRQSFKGDKVSNRVTAIENQFEKVPVTFVSKAMTRDNGVVKYGPNVRSVVFKCDPARKYIVKKTPGLRFRVYYAESYPLEGVALTTLSSNDSVGEIVFETPQDAKYIVAYIWILQDEITADEMCASFSAKKIVLPFAANVQNAEKEIDPAWLLTGMSGTGVLQDGNNRVLSDYIQNEGKLSISCGSGDYVATYRFFKDGEFVEAVGTWSDGIKQSDVFALASSDCDSVRILMRKPDNSNFTSTDFQNLYSDVSVIRYENGATRDYYKSEIDNTAKSVVALQNEPCITFAFITDIHYRSKAETTESGTTPCYNPTLFDDCVNNVKAVADRCRIDFVFGNGDFIDGDVAKATTKGYVQHVMNGFRKIGRPFMCDIGNHDDNRYSLPAMDIQELFANYVGQGENKVEFGPMNGTNYYFDYANLKVRIIVINSNEDGAYNYSESTRQFVADTLENMPENYQAFLFVHTPPGTIMNYDGRVRPHGTDLEAIINESGRMCAMLYGHSHQDNSFGPVGSGAINTYSYLAVCTCCEKCTDVNGNPEKWSPGATMPTRTVDTATEDLWDVVVVRPNSRKINFVRFGAGDDREFSY